MTPPHNITDFFLISLYPTIYSARATQSCYLVTNWHSFVPCIVHFWYIFVFCICLYGCFLFCFCCFYTPTHTAWCFGNNNLFVFSHVTCDVLSVLNKLNCLIFKYVEVTCPKQIYMHMSILDIRKGEYCEWKIDQSRKGSDWTVSLVIELKFSFCYSTFTFEPVDALTETGISYIHTWYQALLHLNKSMICTMIHIRLVYIVYARASGVVSFHDIRSLTHINLM